MEEVNIDKLKEELQNLRTELANNEMTFSEKRAQFKELYVKKELELKNISADYNSAIEDGLKWKEEADSLRKEIQDIRKATSVSESIRLEEIEQMRKNYEKNLAKMEKASLEINQNDEIKKKPDKSEEFLKSVIEPYEDEIQMLKEKIRKAYEKNDELEKLVQTANAETKPADSNDDAVLKKSQSGNDIRCDNGFNNFCSPLSLRRNTDVQSLFEYRTDTNVGENIAKTRTVSENEWSRLHLELSALKNKSTGVCEMCKNYEDQLQSLQNKFKAQVKEFNELSEENQANLRLIFSVREANNKLACQLNDTAVNQEKIITDLSNKYNSLNDFCDRLRVAYERFRESTDRELKHIVHERRDVRMKMERIESSYEHLLGIRGKKAAEMEAEKIDLPTDIETAQFSLLTLKEEMIQIKAANEYLNEKIQSLEIFNKEKEKADIVEKEATLVEYSNDKKELESKTELLTAELNKLRHAHKNSENLEETVRILKTELDTVKRNYSNLESENKSTKKKSQALQQELENSESVQQDFVRLSQTLQIQLEKIRQEEKELRWQFKEDVKACNDCQMDLQGNNSRNKYHCKHCGKVFCKGCLSEILTGVQSRKAEVCKVCHTMLVKDAVPYFSLNKP